jgi:hypothetical protein
MSLGATLKKVFQAKGAKQGAVAQQWVEAWAASGKECPKVTTVESHIARCTNDGETGIRFFFTDSAKAEVLFAVLNLDEPERVELRKLADAQLRKKDPALRVVLDAASIPGMGEGSSPVYQWVEGLLREERLGLTALVVTEHQFRRLPRSYDDLADKIQVHRRPDGEAGHAVVKELAGLSALVISGEPLAPYERWLAAVALQGGQLTFEPVDGLDRFLRDGSLGALPTVEHHLGDLGFKEEAASLPSSPLEVRKLMDTLSRPPSTKPQPAGQRLFLGRKLGIPIAATPAELVEHAIPGLLAEYPPITALEAEFSAMLERQKLRPPKVTTAWIGDQLHVVNPPDAVVKAAAGAHLPINFHPAVGSPTALTSFQDAIANWTTADLMEDPALIQLCMRLAHDATPQRKLEFLHARIALLQGPPLPLPGPAAADPLHALAAILKMDPPPAGFMNHAVPHPHNADALRVDLLRRYTIPSAEVPRVNHNGMDLSSVSKLTNAKPLGQFVVLPGDEVADLNAEPRRFDIYGVPQILLPASGESFTADRLRDLFEDSRAFGEVPDERLGRYRSRDAQTDGGPLPVSIDRSSAQDAANWSKVSGFAGDTTLATVWLALRRALLNAEFVRMPDGRALVPLAAGIGALVRARAHPARDGAVAAWTTKPGELHYRGTMQRYVSTHLAAPGGFRPTYEAGPLVPASLWIAGGGCSIALDFVGSALLDLGLERGIQSTIPSLAQHAARDEEEDD